MKALNYNQVLRSRGYVKVNKGNDETKKVIYEKITKYNKVLCAVEKDNHKKGKSIDFNLTSNHIGDEGEKRFDRDYLEREINMIKEAFYVLQKLKNPKFIYFPINTRK